MRDSCGFQQRNFMVTSFARAIQCETFPWLTRTTAALDRTFDRGASRSLLTQAAE
jgi:hypothetical protein